MEKPTLYHAIKATNTGTMQMN